MLLIARLFSWWILKSNGCLRDFINRIKASQKADGQNRIFIHGEKDFEKYDEYKKNGIPLQVKVYQTLKEIGEQRKVDFNL